jgi:hypothetical protein
MATTLVAHTNHNASSRLLPSYKPTTRFQSSSPYQCQGLLIETLNYVTPRDVNHNTGIWCVVFTARIVNLTAVRRVTPLMFYGSFYDALINLKINSTALRVKVQVKQSHCRPWQALRVPEGWDSQILRQSAHEVSKVVSPTHRPPLPPRK